MSLSNRRAMLGSGLKGIPNNEIWYTNGSTTTKTEPSRTDAFGVEIISNTYDVIHKCWRLKFDGKVDTIGEAAFYNCSSLTSVTIPDGVNTIGNFAFYSCYRLTNVTIPDSVTTIGYQAFYYCNSLTSVTIPVSVTSIGDYAFENCNGELVINSNIVGTNYSSKPGWLKDANFTKLIIGDSVTMIGDYAFADCTIFTSVTIGDGVTSIGKYAFKKCKGILTVNCNIPSPTTSYGAFYGSEFSVVTISDGVDSIGNKAFYNCTTITQVTIPESVTTIGSYAFTGCSGLENVNISDIAAWCNILFNGYESNPLSYASNLYLNNELVTDLTIPNSVTTIGNYAFLSCDSLTSVTIPDSVTIIGNYAFRGCNSLTSVTIPVSVTSIGDHAFEDCSSLTSVTIPDSVTMIGGSAFRGCTGTLTVNCNIPSPLTSSPFPSDGAFYGSKFSSVTISNGVESIGSYAFYNCSGHINIPYSVTTIGNYAFYGCTGTLAVNCVIPSATEAESGAFYGSEFSSVIIGESVTDIGSYAFYKSSLKNITIPNSVNKIGGSAFYDCDSLTHVTIPASVTTIGKFAFYGCVGELTVNCDIPNSSSSNNGKFSYSKFSSVIIGESVTEIGQNAFYGSSLSSIYIPVSVTSIGQRAFEGCSSLNDVYYNGYLTNWYDISFGGIYTNPMCNGANLYINNLKLTELTEDDIPSDMTEIKDFIFNGCISLISVTIPNGVKTIGGDAFRSCSNLTSVTIPNSVTTIEGESFYGCSKLQSVTIPESVTSIGGDAFSSCNSLMSVYCRFDNPSILLSKTVFENGNDNCKFYVPSDLLFEFRGHSQWVNYKSKIYGYDFEKDKIFVAEFIYTTSDGKWLSIQSNAFDATILSHTYNERGVIIFNSKLTKINFYPFNKNSTITSIIIPDTVEEIGANTFSGCTSLTSVTIGRGVNTIGGNAFNGCSGELVVNSNIVGTDYTNNNSLASSWLSGTNFTKINIGDDVTKIGNQAFYGYTSLSSITIGTGVKTIGDYAFGGCTGTLIINSNDIIGKNYSTDDTTRRWLTDSVFSTIKIGDNVTKIGNYVFYNYTCITDLTIGSKVETIGTCAFYRSIIKTDTSVTIPDSVTTIGHSAFYNCTSLTSVTIGDSVTTIRDDAFYNCSSLTSVTIPDSVTTIGDGAFLRCSSLTGVYINDIAAWCNISFSDSYSNPLYHADNLYLNDKLVTNLTIPSSVTSIGSYAFYSCGSLTSVTIPKNVTNIGGDAFYNCVGLTSITFKTLDFNVTNGSLGIESPNVEKTIYIDCDIPANITSNNSLYGINLENATLYIGKYEQNTNTLVITYTNTIGSNAFSDCTIKNVYIYNLSNHTDYQPIGQNAFKNCNITDTLKILCNISGGDINGNNNFANGSFNKVIFEKKTNSAGGTVMPADSGDESYAAYLPGIQNTTYVTKIGEYAFYKCKINSVEICDNITTIGSYAFYQCSTLTSVTVGNGVKTIGGSAFSGCTSLTRVNISDISAWCNISFSGSTSNPLSNTSSNNVCNLYINDVLKTELTIPNSVTTIGDYVFYKSRLTKVTISSGVTKIGTYAFAYCSSLKSVTIPNSVTNIGSYAFSACTSLTRVDINNIAAWCNISFVNSGSNPLSNTSSNNVCNLYINGVLKTELTIPNSVATIGDYVFYKSRLTKVTIPSNTNKIGTYAFAYCSSLENLTIPGSVTTIGSYAFYSNSSIKTVSYMGTIDKWVSIDFNNKTSNPLNNGTSKLSTYKSNADHNLAEISNLSNSTGSKIGDLLIDMSNNNENKEIKKYAFCGAYTSGAIDSIIIKGATSIGVEAFSKMGMKNIVIDDACQTIGTKAFYDCININNIQIGGSASCSLKEIGDNAFATTQLTVKADGVENYLHKFVVFRSSGITITSVQNIFENRIHESALTPFAIYCYSNDNQTVGVWSNTGYTSLWHVQKCTIDSLRQFYGFKNNKVTTGTHWTDIGTDYDIY